MVNFRVHRTEEGLVLREAEPYRFTGGECLFDSVNLLIGENTPSLIMRQNALAELVRALPTNPVAQFLKSYSGIVDDIATGGFGGAYSPNAASVKSWEDYLALMARKMSNGGLYADMACIYGVSLSIHMGICIYMTHVYVT